MAKMAVPTQNGRADARRIFVAAQHARAPECVNATDALYRHVHAFARDRHRCTLTNIISNVFLTKAAMRSEFDALLLTAIPKAASSTLLKIALPSIAPSWRRPREFGKPNSTLGVRASVIDPHLSDCRLLRAILGRALRPPGNQSSSTSTIGGSIVQNTSGASSPSWQRALHAVVVRDPFGRALSAVREVLETQCARWHAFNVGLGRQRVQARWSIDFADGGGNVGVELTPGTVRKPGSTHQPSERCVLQQHEIGNPQPGHGNPQHGGHGNPQHGSPQHGNTSRWWEWDATPASAALAYRAILHDLRLGFDNSHLVPQSIYLRQSLLPPDAILRAESLDADWQSLLQSAGLHSQAPFLVSGHGSGHGSNHGPGHGSGTPSSVHVMGFNAGAGPTPLSQLRHRPDRWRENPSLGRELGAAATNDFCAMFRADYVCLGYAMPSACTFN